MDMVMKRAVRSALRVQLCGFECNDGARSRFVVASRFYTALYALPVLEAAMRTRRVRCASTTHAQRNTLPAGIQCPM